MLTSYYEMYLVLIEVCALFCLLVNVYNLAQYLTQGVRSRLQIKRGERLALRFTAYAQNADRGEGKYAGTVFGFNNRDMRIIRYLRTRLRRGSYLRALDDALERLGWHTMADMPFRLRQLINTAIGDNLNYFSHKDDAVRGLVLAICVRTGYRCSRYRAFLRECLGCTTLYLRVGALRGCAEQGSEAFMLETLAKANKQEPEYSVKLLTDVLSAYRGDKRELFESMWLRLPNYSLNVACSFINLLASEQVCEFAARMLALLQDDGVDKELRIAAIKYFGEVVYQPAANTLAAFLSEEEWECAAVAARVLRRYNCNACSDSLLSALTSRNWHVRYNSAMTIVERCPDQIMRALRSHDRYAQDIIRYAMEMQEGRAG